jgi:uncharacterized protein YndB with AHSA1/START domain
MARPRVVPYTPLKSNHGANDHMKYSFTTYWHIDAPIEAVWEALYDAQSWPRWWKNVKKVTVLKEADKNGVGGVQHHEWGTALPYKLVFDTRTTQAERPHLLLADSLGQLVGTGRWELNAEGSVTVVRYDWNVRTTKKWMNLLAPILRPIFAWNHKAVMDEGGKALARRLNTRLVHEPRHVINVTA